MDNSLLAVRDINHKYIVVENSMPGNFRIILEMTGKLHEERIAFKFHFQYNIEDIR